MLGELIRGLKLAVKLLPAIVAFLCIARIMYRNVKNKKDLSGSKLIFTFILAGVYTLAFGGVMVCLILRKRKLALTGLIIIIASILLLMIICWLINLCKRHLIKYGNAKTVKAKLVGAVEKMSSFTRVAGREVKANRLYSMVFEYEEDGEIKTCETTKLYKLSQVAYINKECKITTIEVYKGFCDIKLDLPPISLYYDLENLSNLDISHLKQTKQA